MSSLLPFHSTVPLRAGRGEMSRQILKPKDTCLLIHSSDQCPVCAGCCAALPSRNALGAVNALAEERRSHFLYMPSSRHLGTFAPAVPTTYTANSSCLLVFHAQLGWHFLSPAFPDHPVSGRLAHPSPALRPHSVTLLESITAWNYVLPFI